MHHALCTMHHAPCTLHFAHAPCALHFAHAPCTCTTCRLAPLHLEPCTLTLHTAHTQQFAHATWGGVVSYDAFTTKTRFFSSVVTGQPCSECCFGAPVSASMRGACRLRPWSPFTLYGAALSTSLSIQNQMHIWRRHCAWQWTLISIVMHLNYVEFAHVANSNITIRNI